jgi:hypothetical protein
MSYRTRLAPAVENLIRAWALPDDVQVEVFLHLTETLPQNLHQQFRPTPGPDGGLLCTFSCEDTRVRGCHHHFSFHVQYDADEQHLWVFWGTYEREGP